MPPIQLLNHVNLETAYLLPDFPYSFGTKTKARYWIETRQAYGQRLYTQFCAPRSESWYKPKPSLYSDIIVMTVDTNGYDAGLVVPHFIDVQSLNAEQLKQFAEYFVLTPFQKDRVMKGLARNNVHYAPKWRNSEGLNLRLHMMAETKPTALEQVTRGVNSVGITTQSAEDALKEQRRREREAKTIINTPTPVARMPNADADDTTGMTPEQIAVYNDLMGKS